VTTPQSDTDLSIHLPSGDVLLGRGPVVVVGPNGSGKTRQTRLIQSGGQQPEFVNALRNTRVAPELPAMGQVSARAAFAQQRAQAQSQHWEQTSEFDSMLSQLLADNAGEAMAFTRRFRDDPTSAGMPAETALSRVEALWESVFLGRQLLWVDWKPMIASTTAGTLVQYSSNQMSDGEKAALFLAGRVFSAAPGILVVDEPETHFHSLLAVRLWDALEDARPDLRFVYITHDLTFAMSRRDARYVLASPTEGLRAIDLGDTVPDDVAEALLGSASLSFYASRVVFCEGTESSYDSRLYGAWFNGPDTVVRPVGGCDRVLRCVDALRQGGLARSLEAVGLIDRDFHSDAYLGSRPEGVQPLLLHEVESLFALPELVAAVAKHNAKEFDAAAYAVKLHQAVTDDQRDALVIQRWKAIVEPHLAGLVSNTSKRGVSPTQLAANLPGIFDVATWTFAPAAILEEQQRVVVDAFTQTDVMAILALAPGKPFLPVAARAVGMDVESYTNLIVKSLRTSNVAEQPLREAIVAALGPYLPARAVAVSGPRCVGR